MSPRDRLRGEFRATHIGGPPTVCTPAFGGFRVPCCAGETVFFFGKGESHGLWNYMHFIRANLNDMIDRA